MTDADLCARCGQPDRLGLVRCSLCTFSLCHSCALPHTMERIRKRMNGHEAFCDRVRAVAELHAYYRMCDDYEDARMSPPREGPDPIEQDFVVARRIYASTLWLRTPHA